MPVLGQDRLEEFEVEGDGSTSLGEGEWIVGGQPQFVGRWIQDDVGRPRRRPGGIHVGSWLFIRSPLERLFS